MGRVHAIPGARDGPCDGLEEFEGWLVRVSGRGERLYDRDGDDLVHERAGLSDCGGRQADVQSVLGVSAVVRVDDFVGCLWFAVRDAVFESAATAASSFAEEQTVFAGHA